MTRPSFSPARMTRAAFAPEWWALGALLAIDLAWALLIGLRFEHVGGRLALVPAGMALLALLRGFDFFAASRTCEYIFLSFAGSLALLVLSYLCLASAGPLVDGHLLALDQALGFDWLALRHGIEAHPALAAAMLSLYESLPLQGIVVTLLLCLRGNPGEMRELWRLSTLACVLCCLGALLWPSLGPFKLFGYDAVFLPAMEKLVAGRDLSFPIENLTGVINFPSFHTVLALTIPYALRRHGAIFWLFALADGLMLLTVPFFGGHYLVDVFGGVAVFATALAIVKLLERRGSPSAASALPESAAACAGACSGSDRPATQPPRGWASAIGGATQN
jgi:hypothetical protein